MFEETNPSDFTDEEIESIINPLFPEETPAIKFLYHGTYNVYLVDNKFIFSFPSKFFTALEKIGLIQLQELIRIFGNMLVIKTLLLSLSILIGMEKF